VAVDLTNDDDDNDNDDAIETTRSSPRSTTRQPTSNGSTPTSTKSPTTRQTASTKKTATVDVDEADEVSSPSPRKKVKPSPSPVVKKAISSVKKAPAAKTVKRDPPLPPTLKLKTAFDTDTAVSECMEGYTFVFSGNMEGLGRDGATELVKILGARVTTAVSKKTDYLVVGDILEDGRPYTEGSKYKRAVTEGCIVVRGEEALYGLCQQYDDKARAARGLGPAPVAAAAAANQSSTSAPVDRKPAPAAKPAPPVAAAANPYARGPVSNPYAKAAANPYAKKAAPSAAPVASSASATAVKSSSSTNNNMLWVDKYKPAHTSEILGNQEAVKKLTIWLKMWESRFNNPQAVGKAFSNPNGPWKAALLSGPPGIGTLRYATLRCP
jgi:replication factor C subunit 1